jgi:hypothetical protein
MGTSKINLKLRNYCKFAFSLSAALALLDPFSPSSVFSVNTYVDLVYALMTTVAPTAPRVEHSSHTGVREVASAARRTV